MSTTVSGIADSEEASSTESSATNLVADDTEPQFSIDTILPACVEGNKGDNSCEKAKAVKRYLGRLLLGGELPD